MSSHWPAAASGTRRLWGAGCEPPATSRTGSCAPPPGAAQTWQLAQPELGSAPPAVFDDHVYDSDAAQLLDVIRRTPAPVRTLLVVGHDPALTGLARTLAEAPAARAGSEEQAAAGRMRAKFPTAAVAAFVFRGVWDQLAPGAARLACFVTPRQLRA